VVLLARNRERLERLAAELGAEAEVCDVSDRAQVEEAARRIGARHAAVQLLVNNAGVPGRKGFLELDPERIEELVRINYLGGVWCLRAFLPLLEAGAPADVVNLVSTAGTIAVPRSGPYSASKHAQLAFSRSVGAELAPRGVRVHTVNPGPVETEGFPQDRFRKNPWTRRWVLAPEEVADAVVRVVERGVPELHVPSTFRVFGLLQSALPGTLARVLASRGRARP
jgi:short-subunit dehydrogenase